MRWKFPDPHTGLKLISAIILLVGLGSAILIYQRAAHDANRALSYEARDGSLYPIMPEDSKQYLRDLELYGGTANVLADEFRRWFVGLWHGKSLAFILACATIIISFGVFYAANYLTPRLKSEVRGDNHPDETD